MLRWDSDELIVSLCYERRNDYFTVWSRDPEEYRKAMLTFRDTGVIPNPYLWIGEATNEGYFVAREVGDPIEVLGPSPLDIDWTGIDAAPKGRIARRGGARD